MELNLNTVKNTVKNLYWKFEEKIYISVCIAVCIVSFGFIISCVVVREMKEERMRNEYDNQVIEDSDRMRNQAETLIRLRLLSRYGSPNFTVHIEQNGTSTYYTHHLKNETCDKCEKDCQKTDSSKIKWNMAHTYNQEESMAEWAEGATNLSVYCGLPLDPDRIEEATKFYENLNRKWKDLRVLRTPDVVYN